MPPRLSPAGISRPLSGPTRKRPAPVRSASAPWSTCCGGIPCVMSMISASGAIRLITPWQVPTKSSWSPKSERNVMTKAPDRRRSPLTAGHHGDGGDESVEIVRLGLGRERDTVDLGLAGRFRADRHRRNVETEGGERSRGGRRRPHDEVTFGGAGGA